MIIKKAVYEKMLCCPLVPPETGGILGITNNEIDMLKIIPGDSPKEKGIYVPDVKYMNYVIGEWAKREIYFAGIFHTHAKQWTRLSAADKDYIKLIMQSMPKEINALAFPLVFPNDSIKGYIAKKIEKEVYIMEDDIQIIP